MIEKLEKKIQQMEQDLHGKQRLQEQLLREIIGIDRAITEFKKFKEENEENKEKE